MSGYSTGVDDSGQATVSVGTTIPSTLMGLLLIDEIVPGAAPSYEVCKAIFADHPLGPKMAEAPVALAQTQPREIKIPGAPEEELKQAFEKEWKALNADIVIRNLMRTSRIYGISSIIVGARGEEKPGEPLDFTDLHKKELYFNVLDPLNTAGSLVLDQDPNSPDFQKPRSIRVGAIEYHPSRSLVVFNEQPIYIEWSNSAFGFVGRSVYQRALFPLKSYVQSMITDQAITEKAALLVAKMKSPGSVIDQRTRSWFGLKRNAIKGGKTGNVVSIGVDESIESIDLKNLKDAAEFARNNILKNIATSANMPASMINQETLAEGFGEGTEDAKQIARFIEGLRAEMGPVYVWFDRIVMHRAWNPEFYATMQKQFPEQYGSMPYETAFYSWRNAFIASWPNLLAEPDSEKAKVDDVVMKAAIGCFEVLAPVLDPENRAAAVSWLADVMNERKLLWSVPLAIDEEALASYQPPKSEPEREPTPESYET